MKTIGERYLSIMHGDNIVIYGEHNWDVEGDKHSDVKLISYNGLPA